MTTDQARHIALQYRSRKDKPIEADYMAYMRARWVLANAGVETITAGQRGFLCAVKKSTTGGESCPA